MSMSDIFYSTETNVAPPVERSIEQSAASVEDDNDQSDCDEEDVSAISSIASG